MPLFVAKHLTAKTNALTGGEMQGAAVQPMTFDVKTVLFPCPLIRRRGTVCKPGYKEKIDHGRNFETPRASRLLEQYIVESLLLS